MEERVVSQFGWHALRYSEGRVYWQQEHALRSTSGRATLDQLGSNGATPKNACQHAGWLFTLLPITIRQGQLFQRPQSNRGDFVHRIAV
jgi:hypothetical protein